MKRVALLLVVPLILIPQVIAQSGDDIVTIPDTAFLCALIEEGVDTNEDSLISFNEAESVTYLDIMARGIIDMTGIEAFVMVDSLFCDANEIETLNLSTLSELTFLTCGSNHIDSLDLSNNPELTDLYVVYGGNLTYLDLSNNASLLRMNMIANNLSRLDISANVNLELLNCNENPLEALDVSKNLKLKILYCQDSTMFDTLDVSNNRALEKLYCGNSLTGLILPDSCALRGIYCFSNFLESIDVSGCPYLEDFRPFNNNLTSLDLSNNPLLKYLSCEQNQLTELDLSNNLELNALWCGENQLTSLDLSQNSKIGSEPWHWDHLNLDNMPSLKEVCVWEGFPGDATISIDGSPNICWDSVSCDGLCPSGIEGFNQSDLTIYPNPTSDILTIETTGFGPHTIRIHSLNGQEIFATTYSGTLHDIDLTFCRKGVYILHIQSDNLTTTRKVVKL